jgi:hypothetical protein
MDMSRVYAINAPDVVAEDFNGQIVILNLANGHYFSLQGIAFAIWTLLLAGHAPSNILASIGEARREMVDESARFVERLVELNLIVAKPGDADASGAIDAAWLGDSPQIEIFDDLAELIFADPIHDVDEQAGWPTPRQTP